MTDFKPKFSLIYTCVVGEGEPALVAVRSHYSAPGDNPNVPMDFTKVGVRISDVLDMNAAIVRDVFQNIQNTTEGLADPKDREEARKYFRERVRTTIGLDYQTLETLEEVVGQPSALLAAAREVLQNALIDSKGDITDPAMLKLQEAIHASEQWS